MQKPKPQIVEELRLNLNAPATQWMTLINTAKYLGVSPMSIRRWSTEEGYAHLNFPKPSVVVDRCYWDKDVIDDWMRSRIGAVSTRKSKTKSKDAA